MTNEEKGFLQTIIENPEDDGLRLVFADWCEDHGDPDRAEFIRLQIEGAKLPEGDPARNDYYMEIQRLWDRNKRKWFPVLSDAKRIARTTICRGFPEKIEITADGFLEYAEQLFDEAPYTELHLRDCSTEQILAIADSHYLSRISKLNMSGNLFEPASTKALFTSPHLCNLTTLTMGSCGIGDDGAKALSASSALQNLTALELRGCWIGDEGAKALADSQHLRNLRNLDLEDNYITSEGTTSLAASPLFPQLSKLSLKDNRISNEGGWALVRASPLQTRRPGYFRKQRDRRSPPPAD